MDKLSDEYKAVAITEAQKWFDEHENDIRYSTILPVVDLVERLESLSKKWGDKKYVRNVPKPKV